MKRFIGVLSFLNFLSLTVLGQGPGSGNCLTFNGASTRVLISDDPVFDHPVKYLERLGSSPKHIIL